MMRLTCRRGLAAAILLFACANASAEEETPEAATGSIAGRVLDADRKPMSAATVALYLDDVEADLRDYRKLKTLESDDSGAFEFRDLPEGWYLVGVEGPGSARTFRYFVTDETSKHSHDFILRKPVVSEIVVRDADGRPVAGATVRSLEWRDETGEFWLRSRENWRLFGERPRPTDADGRLQLPPLPDGAVLTATIDHPQLAPVRVKDATIRRGTVAEVVMQPGTQVTLRIAAEDERPGDIELRLLHDPYDHPSSIFFHRVAVEESGAAQIAVEPGRYSILWLQHEDFYLPPMYSPRVAKGKYLRIGDSANDEFHFQSHPKVTVRGRVVDATTGLPLAKAELQGEIPNVGPDSETPPGGDKWMHADWATTDEKGEYTIKLAAGRGRLSFHGEGRDSEAQYYEFAVAADGSTVAPEIRVRAMPKVTGTVVDAAGRPVPSAVVRFRGLLRHMQPTKTDDRGRFEISPTWFPIDFETEERRPVQPLVAFHPYERLAASMQIDLSKPDALNDIILTLASEKPGALIDDFRDEFSPFERGELPEDRAPELADQTLKGQPALELEGTWLNIDKPSAGLAAFRGKYVLLDFWFIGCGPCHGDFPSVKLLQELYKDHGLVVIAVHDNSANAEAVREHAAKEGLAFPILVDDADGRTNARYKDRGLSGYPSHILIDPDGTVLDDDGTPGPTLRVYKIELIRELLLGR